MNEKFWHHTQRTVQALEAFTEQTGRLLSWLSLLLVGVVFLVVILRYGFTVGSIAFQESAVYLHALLLLGGSAYTLKHQCHVRVDVFFRTMNKTRKAWVNLFGTVFFLVPVCLSIGWLCWGYVSQSWVIREASHDPGGLPIVYLLKSLLLVLVVTLMVQGVAELLKAVQQVCGHEEEKKQYG